MKIKSTTRSHADGPACCWAVSWRASLNADIGAGTTYFLSAEGNDGNDGALARSPWQSLLN